ncbi:MAG TPA: class I SAM-dependent methyltransferase [Candidatus Nanopelagicales bacterium]|nr:class I SAM-dependent methyltransferase [Candidatus Nanopelagicales bacterium]
MREGQTYEQIGAGYAGRRQAEPSWEVAIADALEGATSVVNVGAGAGSYEPAGRRVVAVEPSPMMVAQRPPGTAPVVRAVAEQLPFDDGCFDAALAVLTLHHWTDPIAGLHELRRVAGRQVVVTWDLDVLTDAFWFARDYLPEVLERERDLARLPTVLEGLGPGCEVRALAVPWDCRDGFFAAYWRRPEVYLDPRARAAMSTLALMPQLPVERAVARLRADLDSGRWQERYADLRGRDDLDLGYRLVLHR